MGSVLNPIQIVIATPIILIAIVIRIRTGTLD